MEESVSGFFIGVLIGVFVVFTLGVRHHNELKNDIKLGQFIQIENKIYTCKPLKIANGGNE